MASDTPVKVIQFLSPSSNDICIICYEDLKTKYAGKAGDHGHKINLWKLGEITNAGNTVEKYLQCKLDQLRDLKCICRPCLNKVKKGQELLESNRLKLETSKDKAEETYLRTRVKRGTVLPQPSISSCTTAGSTSSSRKKTTARRLSFADAENISVYGTTEKKVRC